MPQGNPSQRDLAQELWLQDFTIAAISRQLGVKDNTVRQWKIRGGWQKPGTIIPPNPDQPALQAVAERIANLTVTQAERIILAIRDSGIDCLKDCKEAATALSAAYATARKGLGQDDNQVQRVLHVHMMRAGRDSLVLDAEPAQITPIAETPKQG